MAKKIQENKKTLEEDMLISKSNPMVTSKYNLGLNSIKVLNVALAKLNPFEKVSKTEGAKVFIPTTEIKQALGVQGNSIYTQIRRVEDDLSKHNNFYFDTTSENGRTYGFFVLIESAKCIEGHGIEIRFGTTVTPYLYEIQKQGAGFTTYRLANIFNMKSKYSIKIYELLKQYAFLLNDPKKNYVEKSYGLNEFKFLLGIYDLETEGNKKAKTLMKQGCEDYDILFAALDEKSKNKYSRVYSLEQKVIQIAQREIREKTDIDFEYKIGGGYYQNTKTVEFKIFRNINSKESIIKAKAKAQRLMSLDENDFERNTSIIEYVSNELDVKMADAKAIAECSGYDMQIINSSIKLFEQQKNVDNKVGWVISCIKENWAGVGTLGSENSQVEDNKKIEEVDIDSLPR